MAGYRPFSTSVIKVTFDYDPADTVYLTATAVNNIPREGRESEIVPVRKRGIYYLELINDRPSSAFLKISDESFNVLIFPDDTVEVTADPSKDRTLLGFSGNGADINAYYQAKKVKFGYTDTRFRVARFYNSSASYTSIRDSTNAIVNRELAFLREYRSDQELPEWFNHYEEAEIRYLGLGVLTALPHYIEMSGLFEDVLPEEYFSFIQKESINNPEAILSSHYFWFLDDYFMTDLPVDSINSLSGFNRANRIQQHIVRRSKIELSGVVKDIYQTYRFCQIISYYSELSEIDSLAIAYGVADYRTFLDLTGTRSKKGLQGLALTPGDTIPDFYTADLNDSLVSIRDFGDKIAYINFWATWCGPCISNMPALNKMIRDYDGREGIVFLNICIDSEEAKWLTSVERYQLRGTNLFAEPGWSKKLRATFDMKGIPNYVLVDRNNILFENFTDKAPFVAKKIDDLLRHGGASDSKIKIGE